MRHGRGEDRHRDLLAEDTRRRRDGADVHQHPRPEPPPVERLEVVAKRVLVAGSTGEVAEGALVERLAGELFVLAKSCIIASSGATFIIAAISSTKCFSYCAKSGFPMRVM